MPTVHSAIRYQMTNTRQIFQMNFGMSKYQEVEK